MGDCVDELGVCGMGGWIVGMNGLMDGWIMNGFVED